MRTKLTPTRYIPEGSNKLASKISGAVAYLYASPLGKPCAVGYVGKSTKPAFHNSFRDQARRADSVAQWMKSQDEWAQHKATRKAEQKAKLAQPHGLKVGDVLTGQWGYDQTNIEFWQVTKLVGKRTVEIREIGCESVDTEFMQGKAVPLPDSFTSKAPEIRRVSENNSVKLFDFGCYLHKADAYTVGGKVVGYRPQHWTAYA